MIWATLLATVVGPIAAVGITLWYQERSGRKAGERNLFANMMRLRRDPTNPEFVGAFNLVPVLFNSHTNIMSKHASVMEIYNAPREINSDAIQRFGDKLEFAMAELLAEMSKAVNTPVTQSHIMRGAYAPMAWQNDQERQRQMQEEVRAVLTGKVPLAVRSVEKAGDAQRADDLG